MNMQAQRVTDWVRAHPLSPSDVDCATAVMLKILDGKCKMGAVDKIVMAQLYEAVKDRPGLRLSGELRGLIAAARAGAAEAMRDDIYEQRVLAESAISRPVMKAFKAMIRQQGLFDGLAPESDDEA